MHNGTLRNFSCHKPFFFSLEFIFGGISNHKACKEMRDKKDRGDDDVPGDVFKWLGEDSLGLRTQLINNI